MADDKIGNSLGLTPIHEAVSGEIVDDIVVDAETPSDSEGDYQYARDNFYNVIKKGTMALDQMMDIAKASEHPRAYEVISTMMKTIVDANKDLVDMGNKKGIDKPLPTSPDGSSEITNVFVGSTTELQAVLKDLREGNK